MTANTKQKPTTNIKPLNEACGGASRLVWFLDWLHPRTPLDARVLDEKWRYYNTHDKRHVEEDPAPTWQTTEPANRGGRQ